MAIDPDLRANPLSLRGCSSPSLRQSVTSLTALPRIERRATIGTHVGTHNSAAFIPFPTTARHSTSFVPANRSGLISPLVQRESQPLQPRALSLKSKSSNGPCFSISSESHENGRLLQRSNPILDNPLLNYRKKQLQELEKHLVADNVQATKVKSPKNTSNNDNHKNEDSNDESDQELKSSSDQNLNFYDDSDYYDQNKYEYIKKWLDDVHHWRLVKERPVKNKSAKT